MAIARDRLSKSAFQVVTLDLGLPPDPGGTAEGFELLRHIREHYPHTKVVVITGRDEKEHALTAITNGAFDYYQKLLVVVKRPVRDSGQSMFLFISSCYDDDLSVRIVLTNMA